MRDGSRAVPCRSRGGAERLWTELEALTVRHQVPGRCRAALFDAALHLRVRDGTYRAALQDTEDEVSEQTAGRDLRELVDAGLLVARGQARGRYNIATPTVVDIRSRIAEALDDGDGADPFDRSR